MSKMASGRALAALAAVGLTVLGGCKKSEAKTEAAPQAVVIGPENVQVAAVEELRTGPALSGALKAEREAQVRAQAGGTVLRLYADQGQAVSAGQPLARIDDAALSSALLSTQSAVRSAQQNVEVSRRNVERNQTLAAAGAVAERDLEASRNQLAAAQSQLAGARAQLANAQEQLSKTTVRSPISGVVGSRPVSAGDVVQPGTALYTIVDPGSMRLEASVPAAQLGAVRPGAAVRFTVSAYPGRTFTGTVQRINPSADPATGQVPVYVTIPNSEGRLVSGLFAEGRVESEVRQVLLVPANAVDERGVQPSVLKLQGGKARRVAVQLGARDQESERVEVTSGVAAGDTLLVGAALGTTPGTRVKIGTAERAVASQP
jgi:membrane fusion protein (multidrug efflux system)